MRKRLLILMTILVLLLPSVSVQAEEPEPPQMIKIGLKYGNTAVASCSLSADQGFLLGTVTETSFLSTASLAGYRTIKAQIQGSEILLSDDSGNPIRTLTAGTTWCLIPTDHETGGKVSLSAQELRVYRGGMILMPNGTGNMNVVNLVSMDQYLYGVLHAELGQANPLEALKAQAVAARSFAVVKSSEGAHAADAFDLCSTTHCQAYLGANIEYPKTTLAVDETTGLILYHNSKPVAGYYHKNSGGLLRSSQDVWTDPMGYLTEKVDAYSPSYLWTATLTPLELQTLLAKKNKLIGEVQAVSIAEQGSGGNVISLKIQGSAGEAILTKENIRYTLGSTSIKSLLFDLNTGALSTVIYNGTTKTSSQAQATILTRDGTRISSEIAGLYVNNGTGVTRLAQQSAVEGSITFTGKGYGHGLGMAQDSAVAMANQGLDFREILQYFYTKTEVR